MAEEFENDEFLKLLTDALRDGPGSPPWHEAIKRLQQQGLVKEADEYQLLITAREHLESGREYRSVRPGPGFTKKVMEGIQKEASPGAAAPSANWIAIIAGLGILGVLIVLGIVVLRSGPTAPSVEELRSMYFKNKIIDSDFAQGIGSDWVKFGADVVVKDKAIRAPTPKTATGEYQSGGIVLANPIPPQQLFAMETAVRLRQPTTHVDLHMFIADDAQAAKAFVVDLKNAEMSAYKPDGSLAGKVLAVPAGRESLVLIRVDRQFVVVESNGQEVYAGPHGLAADKAKFAGLRFLANGSAKNLDDVLVPVVRILKP